MASKSHKGTIGAWYEADDHDFRELEQKVRRGDRLEFDRGKYAHWGIYVGDYHGMEHVVIHFGKFKGGAASSEENTSGSAVSASSKPEIRADSIRAVLGTSSKVRINNSMDKAKTPLSADVVAERAKKMHRERVAIDYNLIKSNCEHFVNRCRYNYPTSYQVYAAFANSFLCCVTAVVGFFHSIARPRNQ
ncbi:HRAS-like suppressor 2 [Acanthaster planci]|uniref:HRAS-like suppressor 2 n=1 Tax=Acanthaster planci TaxID=133434 RepID=A0A8B7ZZA4_ACAPL|nr:HRAS-like suppressor 2 [Acanthaster planci]